MESLTKELTRKDKFLNHFLPELKKAGWMPFSEELAKKGSALLEGMDFPTSRTEAWKYTRTNRIANLELRPGQPSPEFAKHLIPAPKGNQLVFVNGHFRSDLSTLLPESKAVIGSMRAVLAQDNSPTDILPGSNPCLSESMFSALNTAYAQDGVYVRIPRNATPEHRIEIVQLISGKQLLVQPRNLFILESGSSARMVMHIIADQAENAVLNGVSEVFLGANSALQIDKIQADGRGLFQVMEEAVHQDDDSRFDIRTYTSNCDWVRNNLSISVDGSNVETNLSGAYLLKGKEHVDNHTIVDHRKPHSQSNELYKGLIDEHSTGVFNGKVFVRQDAQKTNAFQSNANIVLTDEASMNSKPELEIYADDVKCSHGSTTGQFDEDALFYLKARGLDETGAYRLLTTAFIGEVIDKIEDEDLRSFVLQKMALGDFAHDPQ